MLIEQLSIVDDIPVFGKIVHSFPLGIKEAFDELIASVPDGWQRCHYGLSHMAPDGRIVYIAASEEKVMGEAEQLNYTRYTIPKGSYLSVRFTNWMSRTHCIKDIFHEMMQDSHADTRTGVIEWYQNDREMFCLIKKIEAGGLPIN